MKKLIFLLFVISCTSPSTSYIKNDNNLKFTDDLTFQEFKKLIEEYAEISPYPNIDE